MQKPLSFLLVLVTALAFCLSADANNQLTVFGGGEDYSNTSPINLVYLDEVGTRTQVLFPASALTDMISEPINSMTFYIDYEGITISGGQLRISVGETSQNAFGGYVETGLTQVATISMTAGVHELVIPFNEPFMYNGGNFVFEAIVEEVTDYSFDLFVGERQDYYSTRTRNQVDKFLPKTTFDYGTSAEYDAKLLPHELTFNTIRAEREDTLAVSLKNIGQNAFTPSFSIGAPFYVDVQTVELAAGEVLDIPVIFAPMQDGNYTGTLTVDCGPAGIHEVALSGKALAAAIDITVGDESDYGSFVPIYGADIDNVGTQGQVIYPAEMLTDMVGGDILGLRFHTYQEVQMDGGVIQLSLKKVAKKEFFYAQFETGLTVVANVVPVFGSTDLEFVFDRPYHYEGGNLLVDCLVTEAGITNLRQTYFYGTPTDEQMVGLARTYYSEAFEYDLVPFLPEATFTYQKSTYERGDVNQDGEVSIGDVTSLISIVLSGADAPAQADCNLDNDVNISDVTALISRVLKGYW